MLEKKLHWSPMFHLKILLFLRLWDCSLGELLWDKGYKAAVALL